MPVLALGGEYGFGTAVTSMKTLATDVRGGVVPLSGHWIAEEQPDFLVEQLTTFFSEQQEKVGSVVVIAPMIQSVEQQQRRNRKL
jgi:hypothetical protein